VSLITVGNLVVSHAVYTCRRCQKFWGRWGPPPQHVDVADPLETRSYPRVTIPNLVALGQTKNLEMLKLAPLGWSMANSLETRFSTTYVTVPNLVILGHIIRA